MGQGLSDGGHLADSTLTPGRDKLVQYDLHRYCLTISPSFSARILSSASSRFLIFDLAVEAAAWNCFLASSFGRLIQVSSYKVPNAAPCRASIPQTLFVISPMACTVSDSRGLLANSSLCSRYHKTASL